MAEIFLLRESDHFIPSGKDSWAFFDDVKPGELIKLKTVNPRKTRRSSLNRLSHMMYGQAAKQLFTTMEEQKAYCKLNFGIPVLTDPRYDDWEETLAYYSLILGRIDYEEKLERMFERHRFYLKVTSLMTDDQLHHYINDCVRHYALNESIVVLPDDRVELQDLARAA